MTGPVAGDMQDETLTSTLEWLMSPACPPIRNLTARDLNTPPTSDHEHPCSVT